MSEKYFDHLENIHQDMELLQAEDVVIIGELLEQVMVNCAQKPFYHSGSGYRFFGASALAVSNNRQEHFPVNSELFFKNETWLNGSGQCQYLYITKSEYRLGESCPIGTRATYQMERRGLLVKYGTYLLENTVISADGKVENLTNLDFIYPDVIAKSQIVARDITSCDIESLFDYLYAFADNTNEKIGKTVLR